MKKNRVLHLHQLAMRCDRSKATCRKLGIHCTRNRRLLAARSVIQLACIVCLAAPKNQAENSLPRETGTTRGMRFDSFSIAIQTGTGDFISRNSEYDLERRVSTWPILETRRSGTLVPAKNHSRQLEP